jgi:aromatic-L-amino-acid decarboxylase
MTLGIGSDNVVNVESDAEFRMKAGALERAIAADRAAGHRPIAIVGVLGTTSSTSVDPLNAIADIAEREKLWYHIDAAYA